MPENTTTISLTDILSRAQKDIDLFTEKNQQRYKNLKKQYTQDFESDISKTLQRTLRQVERSFSSNTGSFSGSSLLGRTAGAGISAALGSIAGGGFSIDAVGTALARALIPGLIGQTVGTPAATNTRFTSISQTAAEGLRFVQGGTKNL